MQTLMSNRAMAREVLGPCQDPQDLLACLALNRAFFQSSLDRAKSWLVLSLNHGNLQLIPEWTGPEAPQLPNALVLPVLLNWDSWVWLEMKPDSLDFKSPEKHGLGPEVPNLEVLARTLGRVLDSNIDRAFPEGITQLRLNCSFKLYLDEDLDTLNLGPLPETLIDLVLFIPKVPSLTVRCSSGWPSGLKRICREDHEDNLNYCLFLLIERDQDLLGLTQLIGFCPVLEGGTVCFLPQLALWEKVIMPKSPLTLSHRTQPMNNLLSWSGNQAWTQILGPITTPNLEQLELLYLETLPDSGLFTGFKSLRSATLDFATIPMNYKVLFPLDLGSVTCLSLIMHRYFPTGPWVPDSIKALHLQLLEPDVPLARVTASLPGKIQVLKITGYLNLEALDLIALPEGLEILFLSLDYDQDAWNQDPTGLAYLNIQGLEKIPWARVILTSDLDFQVKGTLFDHEPPLKNGDSWIWERTKPGTPKMPETSEDLFRLIQ